jgi:hypothetical protein
MVCRLLQRRRILRIHAGNCVENDRLVPDRASERAGGIEGQRQRNDPAAAGQSQGGTQPHQSGDARRCADRTAGVGAQSKCCKIRGDGRGGSATRARDIASGVVGVDR